MKKPGVNRAEDVSIEDSNHLAIPSLHLIQNDRMPLAVSFFGRVIIQPGPGAKADFFDHVHKSGRVNVLVERAVATHVKFRVNQAVGSRKFQVVFRIASHPTRISGGISTTSPASEADRTK